MEAQPQSGTLYLVATPLGNLSDLSARAIDTLRHADLVVAEDTRRARTLLSHLGLHKPLESFHGDSDPKKLARLISHLASGQTLAYVSDGGTPGIADPGRDLVTAAVEAEVSVVPIPGPAAVITALSVSGMVADRFLFAGFAPRKSGDRHEFLTALRDLPYTLALYEAPHRVLDTLQAIAEVFCDRPMMIARELTKQYEELLHGTAADLVAIFTEREPKGEFVLIISGAPPPPAPLAPPGLISALDRMLTAGLGARDIAQIIADLGLLPRREAYQMALAQMKGKASAAENDAL
ncbi:MAG: 16S rRNA (cytidine(1402)-2'-O)-methyltransferase [Armatimonadia bacterium]